MMNVIPNIFSHISFILLWVRWESREKYSVIFLAVPWHVHYLDSSLYVMDILGKTKRRELRKELLYRHIFWIIPGYPDLS